MQERSKKQLTTPTVHETAVRMQAHFARTGTYRTQDVSRVLGDPRKPVAQTLAPKDADPVKMNVCLTSVQNFVRVGR